MYLHVFTCRAYDSLRGRYPAVFHTTGFHRLAHAVAENCSMLDVYMNEFVNGHGQVFWAQLADFLIESKHTRSQLRVV